MVDLEPIRKVAYTCTTFVCMCDDDNFVPPIDELCGELINMALNAAWLGEKEVADHGDVVRHSASDDCRREIHDVVDDG